MNFVYNKERFNRPTYEGDEDTENDKSFDELHNRPMLCSTKTMIMQYPISIKNNEDKINKDVTIFIFPYKDDKKTKFLIYCYMFKDLKKFLYTSPPLFMYRMKDDVRSSSGVDQSIPIMKLTGSSASDLSGINIKLNYFMLLRYTAFLIYHPIEIPTGSVFGVGTHHGLVEKVYEVRPISKMDFLTSNEIDFLALDDKYVNFTEEDFTPGNFPPYKIELLYEPDMVRERERTLQSVPAIENIFHENGDFTMGLFYNDIARQFLRIKVGYEMDADGYFKRMRTFKMETAKILKLGNTQVEVTTKGSVSSIIVTRDDNVVMKEHISVWTEKQYEEDTEYKSIMEEEVEEEIDDSLPPINWSNLSNSNSRSSAMEMLESMPPVSWNWSGM